MKTSSDGSGWGSSSGCVNQGSCARQGANMDTGDSGCGKEAVTQGSCVVRTDSIGQGTPTAAAWARMHRATVGERLRCKQSL